jgi:hypothetical protein
LEYKFGVTNGLTICNSTGEFEDRNYASNKIAEIFCNNRRVMHCLMDCVKQFDMSDATTIPGLLIKTAAANNGKRGGQTVDMLEDIKTLSLEASRSTLQTSSSSTKQMELHIKTRNGCLSLFTTPAPATCKILSPRPSTNFLFTITSKEV